MEVSGQLHAPATLFSGKEPLHPLRRRLGGPKSWSRRSGEEKIPCPYWEAHPGSSSPYLGQYADLSTPAFYVDYFNL
jgi:hypothetical protein